MPYYLFIYLFDISIRCKTLHYFHRSSEGKKINVRCFRGKDFKSEKQKLIKVIIRQGEKLTH